MADAFTSIAVAATTVIALAMLAVAFRAYRRNRGARYLLLTVAFGLFAAKGLLLSAALFLLPDTGRLLAPATAFDALILLALYAAISRR